MRSIEFENDAYEQFLNWEKQNKQIFKKIIKLLDEVRNTPFIGIGKPEALKHNLKGYWSRRINKEHRLVYQVKPKSISCKFHY